MYTNAEMAKKRQRTRRGKGAATTLHVILVSVWCEAVASYIVSSFFLFVAVLPHEFTRVYFQCVIKV